MTRIRVLFAVGVSEEIGWTDYALPKLLLNGNPLSASAVLGLLWAFVAFTCHQLSGWERLNLARVRTSGYLVAAI